MNLTVRLFASLRERAGTEELALGGLPEPLHVGTLKEILARRHGELGSLAGVRGVLGTSYVSDDTELEDGQVLSLIPPVSGGSGAGPGAGADPDLERGVFEIHDEALDPERARRRVAHPSCGAGVVFTGTTRERNRELDVTRLDYEAFPEMASAEMGRIFSECLERFGPASTPEASADELRLRMLVLHRTGTVEIGEPSVVIAVASPHRDAAFLAARFLIDELKTRVPLWKKEHYSDGHHWIGDRS